MELRRGVAKSVSSPESAGASPREKYGRGPWVERDRRGGRVPRAGCTHDKRWANMSNMVALRVGVSIREAAGREKVEKVCERERDVVSAKKRWMAAALHSCKRIGQRTRSGSGNLMEEAQQGSTADVRRGVAQTGWPGRTESR